MRREKIDRSETAIPCMIGFTEPITIAGLPKNIYYNLLGIGFFSLVLFKNLIIALIILALYVVLRRINAKDNTKINGFLNMCRKKYISY